MMSDTRTRGFSLIELMITILIVAVLTAIAWPSFRDFMHRNQVSAQANQVLASLQYARNEAVGRRYPTALCGSSDGSACGAGGVTDSLEGGWMIWRDSTLTGVPAYDPVGPPPDELLRVTQAQPNVSIRMFPADVADDRIAFDQRGAVIGAGGVQSQVVICAMNTPADVAAGLGSSTDRVPGKFVRVDASGRVTVKDLAVGADCSVAPAP